MKRESGSSHEGQASAKKARIEGGPKGSGKPQGEGGSRLAVQNAGDSHGEGRSHLADLRTLLMSKIGPVKKNKSAKPTQVQKDSKVQGQVNPPEKKGTKEMRKKFHKGAMRRSGGRNKGPKAHKDKRVRDEGHSGKGAWNHKSHGAGHAEGGGHKFAPPQRSDKHHPASPRTEGGQNGAGSGKKRAREVEEGGGVHEDKFSRATAAAVDRVALLSHSRGAEEEQGMEASNKRTEGDGQQQQQANHKPPIKAGNISSNWMALSQQLKDEKASKKAGKKEKNSAEKDSGDVLPRGGKAGRPGYIIPEDAKRMNIDSPIAMDCEMVGVGEDGKKSVLARVSITDFHGNVLIDSYVAPQEKVTDLRTWVSGIRWQDLKGAPKFAEIQKIVGHITKDRVIVGHSLNNDLEALMLKHPKNLVRDTAKYKPYMRGKRARKLRDLVKEELGLNIQSGEHSSVEDARCALLLYKQVRATWEKEFEEKAKKLAKFSKKKAAAAGATAGSVGKSG